MRCLALLKFGSLGWSLVGLTCRLWTTVAVRVRKEESRLDRNIVRERGGEVNRYDRETRPAKALCALALHLPEQRKAGAEKD